MNKEGSTATGRGSTLFIVGAGFSRAIIAQAPLNHELLGAVIMHGAPILKRYAERYGERDIERLLTLIDLNGMSGAGNEGKDQATVEADRLGINAEIAAFFRTCRFSRIVGTLPEAAESFASALLRPGDGIVSLNYDCLLEGLLDHAGVWTPNGGYGRITNVLGNGPVTPNPRGITIHKIHGSENFVESRVFRKDGLLQTVIGYEINAAIYPRSAQYIEFGGGMYEPRPYIIAPSFVKLPHVDIAATMIDLLQQIEGMRHLVIIGCSFRIEDNFLWLLLTRFLNRPADGRLGLTIVDPGGDGILKRMRRYWVGDIESVARVTCIKESWLEAVEALREALAGHGEAPSAP